MAVSEEDFAGLSPETERNLKFFLQDARSRKVKLRRSAEGKYDILNVDQRGLMDQGGDAAGGPDDCQMKAFLELVEAIKMGRDPRVSVMDRTKATTDEEGSYYEVKHFKHLEQILGKGGYAGDVVVVKDHKTETEHAMKTVMIADFEVNEIRAWVDLGESDTFPSLYLARVDQDKIIMHMEKIDHGVTLDEIIHKKMDGLRQRAPGLAYNFSVCVFYDLLSAVREMHDKNWAHGDLHGENVMLTKDTVTLKVLDFGLAENLREGIDFKHDRMKDDILSTINLLHGLYVGHEFRDNAYLRQEIEDNKLQRVAQLQTLPSEQKNELLKLISMTYEVTLNPYQAEYGDTRRVTDHIYRNFSEDQKKKIMKEAAVLLFPECHSGKASGDEVDETAGAIGGMTMGAEMRTLH